MNNQSTNQDTKNEELAAATVKALGYTENGGKPDIKNPVAGKTGEEKSIFQFEKPTWDAYSKQVFGKVEPLTPDNETHVMLIRTKEMLDKGYSPQQIASMHNAGAGEPNAYTGKFSDGSSSVGVNKKYDVKYDVPSYVSKFDKYLSEFTGKSDTPTQPQSPVPVTSSASTGMISSTPQSTESNAEKSGLLKGLIKPGKILTS